MVLMDGRKSTLQKRAGLSQTAHLEVCKDWVAVLIKFIGLDAYQHLNHDGSFDNDLKRLLDTTNAYVVAKETAKYFTRHL